MNMIISQLHSVYIVHYIQPPAMAGDKPGNSHYHFFHSFSLLIHSKTVSNVTGYHDKEVCLIFLCQYDHHVLIEREMKPFMCNCISLMAACFSEEICFFFLIACQNVRFFS